MSVLEPESACADMAENSNPEKDSLLTQGHEINCDGLDVRENEGDADEELAVKQEKAEINTNIMSNNEHSELAKSSTNIKDNSTLENVDEDLTSVNSSKDLSGESKIKGKYEISTDIRKLNFGVDDTQSYSVDSMRAVRNDTYSEIDNELSFPQETTLNSHSEFVESNELEKENLRNKSEFPNISLESTDNINKDIEKLSIFQSCADPSIADHTGHFSKTNEPYHSSHEEISPVTEDHSNLDREKEFYAVSESSQHISMLCHDKIDAGCNVDKSDQVLGEMLSENDIVNNTQLSGNCDSRAALDKENDACNAIQEVISSKIANIDENVHKKLSDYNLQLTEHHDISTTNCDPNSNKSTELSDVITKDNNFSDSLTTASSNDDIQKTSVIIFQEQSPCKENVIRSEEELNKYNPPHIDSSLLSIDRSDQIILSQEASHENQEHQNQLLNELSCFETVNLTQEGSNDTSTYDDSSILHPHVHSSDHQHDLLCTVDYDLELSALDVSHKQQQQTDQKKMEPPQYQTSSPTQEMIKNATLDNFKNKIEDGVSSNSTSTLSSAIVSSDTNQPPDKSSDPIISMYKLNSNSCSKESLVTSIALDSPDIQSPITTDQCNSDNVSEINESDSASNSLNTTSPQQSTPTLSHSNSSPETFNHYEDKQSLVSENSRDYDIYQDLHSLLISYTSGTKPLISPATDKEISLQESRNSGHSVNGQQQQQQPVFGLAQIQDYNRQLLEQMKIRDDEITKLKHDLNCLRETQGMEQVLPLSHQADDLYLPQIKVLEHTIAQQQKEIQALKLRLTSQDESARKTISSLQNELKSRVGQVTKMLEDCKKEKSAIVIRFAESEAKNMEAKRIAERSETKVKEAMKDKEMMLNALKAAKAEKLKALSSFETKCIEISNLQKEVEKLKETVVSSEHHIKWFQNKLSTEAEEHKETKINLDKTAVKLKEAKEETEIIRKECQAIVKRYQESEEIKSNNLDKELKLKETELRTQLQERNDNEEIHQILKRELDSLKAQHKDTIEEAKTYKDKVHCLEEECKQNNQIIENYQEIMQRQKTSNAELNLRITSLSDLENENKSCQEQLQTLQAEVCDLRATNEELLKDMDSCRERESKMLTLQSELSHANALLRSENTSLNNKISSLASDLEKSKIEIQTHETTLKNLREKCDKEKAKYKEEADKMTAILAERSKECNEFRQKWEDEMDNSKTLKRRHTNNVKDLTRQLHQVHKRLESIEGKGDSGSMGSRTNSNGSLNSIETVSRAISQPPIQECPVITEQVEVDKQVLIERIVRLQKSLARKNEKLEFLSEHIQQLLEDIKKKNKVIQCYALREEAGTLSSETMDENKEKVKTLYKAKVQKEMQTLLARKGGIMASLYSAQQQDGAMTLELSLQISRKLQEVLEDTILKNITLKESLDTLGEEIARLSQENRKLQLRLQKLEGNVA